MEGITLQQFREIIREELTHITDKQQSRIMTVEELCQVMRLTRDIIYRKNMKGEIPGAYKQGKRIYYDRQVVEDWLLSEPLTVKTS